MTYYYQPGVPMYYGNQGIPYTNVPYQGWSQFPQQQKVKGGNKNKGNVCAYAPDQPVTYNKLNILHWPSDDYKKPHPKGFSHTLHTQQTLGQYVPHR
ncbi:hypothetical protein GMD78_09105 [Ornithinibacillus sp. L9]|uniref:Uncharacterized protein n=1 Tax=Ornithinibacillus caprae TaxID=2678566 RepID=A0A6N8FIN9_9BACI|nr:hypothetical protein [Ornithinibacillus caprae]MUK88546.1 hypothetical protein [Ornithinibacillus caprae]